RGERLTHARQCEPLVDGGREMSRRDLDGRRLDGELGDDPIAVLGLDVDGREVATRELLTVLDRYELGVPHAELLENTAHLVVADDDPGSIRGEPARVDRPDLGKDLDGRREAERLRLARRSDLEIGSRDDRELGLVERVREALADQAVRHLAADLFGEGALEHRTRDSTAPEALDLRLLRDALVRALVLAAHPVGRDLHLDPPLHRTDLFDLNLHAHSATRARRGPDAIPSR